MYHPTAPVQTGPTAAGPSLLRSVYGDTRGSRPRTAELANPQH